MCPSCSKFCCNLCFKKWLTEHKSECPYCRDHLRVTQLIPLRFLNEMAYAVENIIDNKKQSDDTDICPDHKIKMSYFCITCQKSICSDCAMFSDEHKTHEFAHLQGIYEKNFDELKAEMHKLREKIKLMEDF